MSYSLIYPSLWLSSFWAFISINYFGNSSGAYSVFHSIFLRSFYLVTIICLIVFYISGFYTHTRSYRSRYKAFTIIRAVTISYLLFVFCSYFLLGYKFIPRGVSFIAWILTMASVGGARLIKTLFLRYYNVEKKRSPLKGSSQVRNVLVIGGAGYIGSVLVNNLIRNNYKVRVLDNLMYGYQPLKKFISERNFEFIKGDFRNVEAVVKSVKDMDAIVHLGAIVGDPACNAAGDISVEINTAATIMIGQACKGFKVNKFLYASSCSVYGASSQLINEKSSLNPVSLYAKTKIDAENALLKMADSTFRPTIMRFATAFGSSYRPRFDLVVNLLTARAMREGKITIFNKDQWRPFIHLVDIASAIILLLESPTEAIGDDIFNIGSNHMNYQIGDLGRIIEKIIPGIIIEVKSTEADTRNYRVSFDKIKNRFGFNCHNSIEDGVKEIKMQLESSEVIDYLEPRFHNHVIIRENGCSEIEPLYNLMCLSEINQ